MRTTKLRVGGIVVVVVVGLALSGGTYAQQVSESTHTRVPSPAIPFTDVSVWTAEKTTVYRPNKAEYGSQVEEQRRLRQTLQGATATKTETWEFGMLGISKSKTVQTRSGEEAASSKIRH